MALFGIIPRLRREVTVFFGNRSVDRVLGMPIDEVYRTQPELQAVVSFLASSVAQLPLKCYARESDTDRRRVTDGPLALLIANPGGGFTSYELMLGTMSDICLYGCSLWWVLPSKVTASGWEMRRIPFSWVDDIKTVDGFEPSSYRVVNRDTSGIPVDVPASQVVRFATYNPKQPSVPLSPVDALKQVLAERASSREYRNKVWLNGGWFNRYIERPAQDGEWSAPARERFAKSMKDRFSGPDGVDSGGIPILEDGMRFVTSTLNAKEAEWSESMRLTREDVAAAYHVNPAMVWSNDGQTYASVKENARSLYSDTLGPNLKLIEDRINATLAPMVGEDARCYVEFDLSAKLAGSFEEQASVLSQSVGAPWMTRNEARAKQNMPAVEGGDELITPLNVLEGGLASPHDTDPTASRVNAAPVAYLQDGVLYALPQAKGAKRDPFGEAPAHDDAGTVTLKSKGEPPEDSVDEITQCLARFAERQSRRVLQEIEKAGVAETKDATDTPAWWDGERWNRELADDLLPLFRTLCDLRALATLADLQLSPAAWVASRAANYLRAMAEQRAESFNFVTLQALKAAMAGDVGGIGATAKGVFELARTSRAESSGRTYANSVSGFATKEAVHQAVPEDTDEVTRTKTWVHHGSKNPRSKHAAMDGETVGLDEKFSNGQEYPGDTSAGAAEVANCHCTMDVSLEKGNGGQNRPPLNDDQQETAQEVASQLGLDDYNPNDVYEAYRRCQQTIGQAEAEWGGLTIAQQTEVLDELRTRDQQWVATGKTPPISYKDVSKAERRRMKKNHEADGHAFVCEQGFRTEALPTIDGAVANIDMRLNGIYWELKTVNGNGGSLNRRFDEGVSKWERLHRAGQEMESVPRIVVDNRFGTMSDKDAISKTKHNIEYFENSSDRESIAEVLLITSDEKLLRIKK